MKIILASGSPRRRELLEMLGVKNMEIIPARGEEAECAGMTPEQTVTALSRAKAEEVNALHGGDAVIIAADTIVELDGRILGKPKDAGDAKAMLSALSGREHRVFTGVTIISPSRTLCGTECTHVGFRELSPDEIDAYIATGEPLDKAGAYGAQGIGSLFVDHISGDFFNVVGLPLCRLGIMLKELGVNLL